MSTTEVILLLIGLLAVVLAVMSRHTREIALLAALVAGLAFVLFFSPAVSGG